MANLTCAACGTTKNVDAYTIVTRDGARVVDLCRGDAKEMCAEHAGPQVETTR